MLAKWRFKRALKALEKSEHQVLRDYASAHWPEWNAGVEHARFLALDFELDGLSKDAHLLQAGWLPFEGRSITLGKAQSLDIRSHRKLDDNAVTIHGIGEQRATRGTPLEEVAIQLLDALAGSVLIAHAAVIERSALQRMVKKLFGVSLPIRVICTMTLERMLNSDLVGGDAYRLDACRKRYGLPDYAAHDALTDAIAAAELFVAQLSRMDDQTTLKQIEHR